MEVWKDIPGYEERYQVSNIGNVRSLDRFTLTKTGFKQFYKGRLLKQKLDKYGYYTSGLSTNSKKEWIQTHQLVAMAFLNHVRCGYDKVVDHVNNISTDNRLTNLQVTTQRVNALKDTNRGISKYAGVTYRNDNNKWRSRITIKGKRINLGHFDTEQEAADAYKKALSAYSGS